MARVRKILGLKKPVLWKVSTKYYVVATSNEEALALVNPMVRKRGITEADRIKVHPERREKLPR